MAKIRYGARDASATRQLEHEAPGAKTWADAVTAVYETDPELIAAVLPKPLTPGPEPLVRITISSVKIPGLPALAAAWIGVPAMHGDQAGEYPLFMPNTAEWSIVVGRETFGEPKKFADVWVKRDGDQVQAGIARMGYTICEIRGQVRETRVPYTKEKLDFWIKFQPSVEGINHFEGDPVLVYGEKSEEARVFEGIDGDLILKDSPFDPIADLVVRRIVDINWSERASTQVGRVVAKLDPDDVLPFVHQRYDDLSMVGKLG